MQGQSSRWYPQTLRRQHLLHLQDTARLVPLVFLVSAAMASSARTKNLLAASATSIMFEAKIREETGRGRGHEIEEKAAGAEEMVVVIAGVIGVQAATEEIA